MPLALYTGTLPLGVVVARNSLPGTSRIMASSTAANAAIMRTASPWNGVGHTSRVYATGPVSYMLVSSVRNEPSSA